MDASASRTASIDVSYEPDVHAAQMIILRELLFVDELSFGALRKATDMDSDLFNFHLKQLVHNLYVIKRAPGRYALTPNGKTYANRMDTDDSTIEKQPKLSVVIIVENDQGKQLYQERLKQPYFGYWGHPTGKIRWGETMIETAERELMEESGLTADLRVVGMYHKLDYDQSTHELREDKYFCMVHGINPRGTIVDGEGCRNVWLSVDEFMEKPKRFGDPVQTSEIISRSGVTIVETKDYYESAHY
jgi:ADP-ribose pyrophosphatase YjhB (NUDIX family)